MSAPPTTLPPRVSVIGAGSWGIALTLNLARNIPEVCLWGRAGAGVESLAQSRQSRYLPEVALPSNVRVTAELEAVLDYGLGFVVALPSHAFGSVLADLRAQIEARFGDAATPILIWGTKGFEPESGDLLSEVGQQIFGSRATYAAVSGPSFANDMARGLPTALTVASTDQTTAATLANWFRTPSTRVYFSDDLVGVQLGGATKNVLAIAVGLSDGLGLGANARAALITRGLAELTRLGTACGGRAETLGGLTGVGDLILTCTDDQSRNRRFGLGLASGKSAAQVRAEIGQEVEGIATSRVVYEMSRRLKVEMPIVTQVYHILHCGHDPRSAVQQLLQRQPRPE